MALPARATTSGLRELCAQRPIDYFTLTGQWAGAAAQCCSRLLTSGGKARPVALPWPAGPDASPKPVEPVAPNTPETARTLRHEPLAQPRVVSIFAGVQHLIRAPVVPSAVQRRGLSGSPLLPDAPPAAVSPPAPGFVPDPTPKSAIPEPRPLSTLAPRLRPSLSSPAGRMAPPTTPATPPRRQLSVQPEAAVYTGPSPRAPSRVTLRTIRKKYESGEPLTMVTAYDYPSAVHVEAAGIDICLVGDSVAMVVHGHDTTLPIRMDEMLAHCKAVARGARRAFLVGDLPFGCYETDARDAVRSAVRMLKEGGMDAVKLEGGSPARVEAARAIVETGVAVMGHVGLTPQSVSVIGGFRPQAQVAEEALRVLDQARALQAAGCFALVLECIPGPIAAAITRALTIPTIGIGAGGECSGQVLVYHDLLGMMSHPHHAKVTPKFCKQYARVGEIIGEALQRYRQEVEDRTFPGPRYSPYVISDNEVQLLAGALRSRGLDHAAEAAVEEARKAAQARAEAAAAAAAARGGGGGDTGPSGSSGGAAKA